MEALRLCLFGCLTVGTQNHIMNSYAKFATDEYLSQTDKDAGGKRSNWLPSAKMGNTLMVLSAVILFNTISIHTSEVGVHPEHRKLGIGSF